MLELVGYRIIEKLGENEDVSLYRLLRLKDNVNIIAKTTNNSNASLNVTTAFQNEFEQLVAMKGRGGLTPYSLEFIANQPFLLFHDPGGKTLSQLFQTERDSMKLEDLLQLAVAIVDCLHTIHQLHIVLHEITPLHLIVSADRTEVKCVDIRSCTRRGEQKEATLLKKTSLPYLSPEQTGRTGIKPNYRTDFYSIGVILYEWFSKYLPFNSDNSLDLIYHHLATTPDPISHKNPAIPKIISDIVNKCMEKMPEARYASAYGIKADLEECLLQFRVMGKIKPFPLANRDFSEKSTAFERLVEQLERGSMNSKQPILYNDESLKKVLHQSLQGRIDDIDEFVMILLDKTGGKLRSLKLFLQEILEQELLFFDVEKNKWDCDLERVIRLDIPEDVASALPNVVNHLPEQSKQLLSKAAFLGKQFNLDMLSLMTQLNIEQLIDWAEMAVSNRILQRIHSEPFNYLFQHDSIHQLAYERISESERKTWHMEIGFLLADRMRMGGDIHIFTIVHHLNQAVEQISIEKKQRQLVALNVEAGLLAKEENRLAKSLHYLRLATDLIVEEDWQQDYSLTYRAFKERAEVEFLCSHYANADKLFKILLEKAISNLDKAKVRMMMMRLEISRDHYENALAIGELTLELLAVNHRFIPTSIKLSLQLQKVRWKLRYHSIHSIRSLLPMKEERLEMAMSVLACMSNASFLINKDGWIYTILKMIELTLDYGLTEEAAVAFSGYALILNDRFREYDAAYEWGMFACTLAQRDRALLAQASTSFLLCYDSWRRYDGQNLLTLANRAIQAAAESDNVWQTNHAMLIYLQLLFQFGYSLQDIYSRILFHSGYFEKNVDGLHWRQAAILAQFISELTRHRSTNDAFSETDVQTPFFINDAPEGVKMILQEMVYIYQYIIGYLLGDVQKAFVALERCLAIAPTNYHSSFEATHHFYHVLTLKELYVITNKREQKEYYVKMRSSIKKLKSLANRCPENYMHKYLLAKAELKGLKERNVQARGLYEQALDIARAHGHCQDVAIIAECFAKYELQRGKLHLAKLYMNEAYESYRIWGAVVKTDQLVEKYNHLLKIKKESDLERVDYLSVVMSAQALSSEMEMNRLLNMLMRIMLQNAGAEYGALIFNQEDEWFVEAYGTINDLSVESIPLDQAKNIVPKAIIEYTARAEEEIVLNDVGSDGMFTRNVERPFSRLKSVLCLPIKYQNKLISLLYMENNLATGIFTEERLDILKLLSSQCAIAITNAKLFTGIQHLKDHLEEQVIERTESLEKSMKATSEALAEMTVYAERTRIAQEIHDIVGHTLTSTVLQIEAGKRLLHHDLESATTRLEEAQALVRHSLSEIRNSVHMLKEDKYYDIMNALQQLIDNTEKNTGVIIHATIDSITHLSLLHKKVIYHALQEGLTNGIRHGKSTEFSLSLHDDGSALHFRLIDNGIGASRLKMGFGLTMMNERVQKLKGTLTVHAEPNQGCVLQIHIPY